MKPTLPLDGAKEERAKRPRQPACFTRMAGVECLKQGLYDTEAIAKTFQECFLRVLVIHGRRPEAGTRVVRAANYAAHLPTPIAS